MPPDAETMTRISRGIRETARLLGCSCTALVRLGVSSRQAQEAGIGTDGVLRTQEQAEVFLDLLRMWYAQHRKSKGRQRDGH